MNDNRKKLRLTALVVICLIGQIFPVMSLFKTRNDWITAFNMSPHHTVFANYPFFSQIKVVLKYDKHIVATNSVDLYNATNLYMGKNIYSLFYMDYIYKSRELSKWVTLWYFCNNKKFSTQINSDEKLEAMRIEYVHRRTGETVVTKRYLCKDFNEKFAFGF